MLYKLIRSRRKSVCLQINISGEVIIRAPYKYPESEIKSLLLEKENWIRKKLREIEAKSASRRPRQYAWGESLSYLGQEYDILPLENCDDIIVIDSSFRVNARYSDRLKQVIMHWYWMKADVFLKERCYKLAAGIGVKFNKVSLTTAGKKWGSCSSKGNIRLNWRLIMLPQNIIDYIIIHELSHLKELNHSDRFWGLVGTLMPDYGQREQWLKDNGHKFIYEYQ